DQLQRPDFALKLDDQAVDLYAYRSCLASHTLRINRQEDFSARVSGTARRGRDQHEDCRDPPSKIARYRHDRASTRTPVLGERRSSSFELPASMPTVRPTAVMTSTDAPTIHHLRLRRSPSACVT